MRTRKNTALIVLIALMVGLLATAWNVMANITLAPVLVPCGVYTPPPPEGE